MMNLEEFVENYGDSPISEEDMAHLVVEEFGETVPGCAKSEELLATAGKLLNAMEEFRTAMEDAGLELG